MKEIRIATHKVTGRKHIVNRIDFNRDLVFVYGPVTGYSSVGKTEHLPGGSFPMAEVEIVKVEKDGVLAKGLYYQALDLLVERGFIKLGRGKRGKKMATQLKPIENVGI